jgi:hypothetical protein
MGNPEKTLLDELYEVPEMKSNTMTKEEFDKLPLNELYVAHQLKKSIVLTEEEKIQIRISDLKCRIKFCKKDIQNPFLSKLSILEDRKQKDIIKEQLYGYEKQLEQEVRKLNMKTVDEILISKYDYEIDPSETIDRIKILEEEEQEIELKLINKIASLKSSLKKSNKWREELVAYEKELFDLTGIKENTKISFY